MSKDLTDVDQFSSPIHVPEGTDSRDNAAGDVELIAQRLANRTHHLNTHAAKVDVTNTFTEDQIVDGRITCTSMQVQTITASGDVVTVNEDLLVAEGLIVEKGGLEVKLGLAKLKTLMVLGSGSPSAPSSLLYGITYLERVWADSYEYTQPHERTVLIPIHGLGGGEGALAAGEGYAALAPNESIDVPLHLPVGAKLIRARLKIGSGVDYRFDGGRMKHFMQSTGGNLAQGTRYSGPSGHNPSIAIVGVNFFAGNATGVIDAEITDTGTIVGADKTFFVTLSNTSASVALEFYGLEMTAVFPGPQFY